MSALLSRSIGLRATALAVLLASCAGAGAVAQPTLTLRGNVGASFFQSPNLEKELLNSGTDLGVEADLWVYRGLAITVQGNYDQFTLNRKTARIFGFPDDRITLGDLSFASGSVGLRYTFLNDSDAHPYVAGGVGLYHVRRTDVFGGGEPDEAEVQRGFHVAAGANFRLDDTFAVFVEPRYTFIDPKAGGVLGPTVPETPRYFTLRLGLDVRMW